MNKYALGAILGLSAFLLVGGTVAAARGIGGGFGPGAPTEQLAELANVSVSEAEQEIAQDGMASFLDSHGVSHQELDTLRSQQRLEHQADVLGISTDELTQQLRDKTFAQLLDEKGISHTALQEQMREQRTLEAKTHLQEMVDNGTITQDEMDERLEHIQQHTGHAGMSMHGRPPQTSSVE